MTVQFGVSSSWIAIRFFRRFNYGCIFFAIRPRTFNWSYFPCCSNGIYVVVHGKRWYQL